MGSERNQRAMVSFLSRSFDGQQQQRHESQL